MSAAASAWADRQVIASPAMKAVLDRLAWLHKEGRDLFPSQATLASRTALSPRCVWESLELLEHFGLIRRRPRSRRAGRISDVFELVMTSAVNIDRHAISVARRGLRAGSATRSGSEQPRNQQLAPGSSATRSGSEGVGDEEKKEASHRKLTPEEGNTREGRARLAVVAGGRS
jgi:hypothetical protein